MQATDELSSFLELCFGDADDEEGLEDLRLQLSIYSERAVEFRDQLAALLERADGEECQTLLQEYAHQGTGPSEAVDWFRWLQDQL